MTAARIAFAIGLALASPLARAQAGLLVPTSTGVADPAVLSLREMVIDVGVARGYARVNVRQVFENHTGRVQEGTYRFALPPGAAVGDFAVWDGLVRIPGVILEKQRARAIYRDLTAQRIDPGLLQQGEEDEEAGGASRPSGSALFSVSVAPIPGHGTKRLELQFQQEVPFLSRQGEFRLALRPPDGAPPVAGLFEVRVRVEGADILASTAGLPLDARAGEARFSGRNLTLDRDLVVRLRPTGEAPLRFSTFRNPDGRLPDGLALAPWERPAEVPPERDGFFLLEMLPAGETRPADAPAAPREAATLVVLFDTSLSHRWSGLEASYASLVRALEVLGPADRFAVLPFDRQPAEAGLASATPEAKEAALRSLRERPLSPGSDLVAALMAGRRLAGAGGRLLLLTDGHDAPASKRLDQARGGLPLFVVASADAGESLRAASTRLLAATATSLEADLFFEQLVSALPRETLPAETRPPFTAGDARLRDVYPLLVQPPAPGALSGWIGRYAEPRPRVKLSLASPLLAEAQRNLEVSLPERDLEARDLPRRWARARVDHLLALIEREGERREWVDEIVALSKRYKFVTPYTAFLAAPRSLLRPRRIQPGDPVLRVECDPGIVSALALFPFGLRLPLVQRPGTTTWEGRFLVPEGLPDGRYEVRVLLRDRSGARIGETKSFVLDGRAPEVRPEPLAPAQAGQALRVSVRADADVVLLSARLGELAPVPLRWDAASKRSVGTLRVPAGMRGTQQVVFEAVDAAKNRGFARRSLEVSP